MHCPRCDSDLVKEGGCLSCVDCGGILYTQQEAIDHFELVRGTPCRAEAPPVSQVSGADPLACPACALPMARLEVAKGLLLDRCGVCGALFFDAGESLRLKGMLAADHDSPDVCDLRGRLEQVVWSGRDGPYR